MNTEQFFHKILPQGGLKVLAELVPFKDKLSGAERQGWRYSTYSDFGSMAEAVAQFEAKGRTVYHACNSYGDWYDDSKTGKKRLRTQRNVVACRSIYDDIDVGKEGCYDSTKEAMTQVKAFCAATGMPAPLVVYSGGGLHLYWPMTRDMEPAEWQRLANLKRAATMNFGLKVDPACDTDSARVLRPVGSLNRKREPFVEVVAKNDPAPSTPEAIELALQSYCDAQSVVVRSVDTLFGQRDFSMFGVSNDLAAVEYPKSFLLQIAGSCAQVAHFRNTGSESEPEWYANLGLAKHCEDGEALAQEWSSRHDDYNPDHTRIKMDQWGYGPTTCAKFQQIAAHRCTGCIHASSVKSPIQLGYSLETVAPIILVAQPPEVTSEVAADVPVKSATIIPMYWPSGFESRNGNLHVRTLVDDVPTDVLVASPLFYPVERIRMEDGTYGLTMHMVLKGGAIREFDIATKVLADPRSLKMALSAYEISVFNDKHVVAYMASYKAQLMAYSDEVNTFTQMGWTDDFSGFLIGTALVTKDTVSTVRVSSTAITNPKLRAAYDVRGTAQEWIDGVDTLYNRPNGEPYQYTICTVFGSPLVPLLGYAEWNGIPLALTSDRSGLGKSTVARIAINALCDSGMTTVTDTTAKALVRRASDMKNLVLLFDEVTKSLVDPQDLSDSLYALSNGQAREGLTSEGTARKLAPPFKLNSILTGNKNLMHQVAESPTNPEAAQMRVFEIDMEHYTTMDSMTEDSKLHAAHHELALHITNNVTSTLAEPYLQYILANKDAIRAQLQKTAMAICAELGGRVAKERFYAYHVACSLVGGAIARKLGYVKFSINDLKTWAFKHIDHMRFSAAECRYSTQDQLAAMLADMHGTIIVTKNFDTLTGKGGKTELPMTPVRNPISGRIVLGSPEERAKCYITVRAIDEWCKKNNVGTNAFRRQLQGDKLLRPPADASRTDQLVSVGRGVPHIAMGRTRCLEFDMQHVQGYIEDFVPKLDNVVAISSHGTEPLSGDVAA